jgi:hypothetical protein
MRGLLFLKVQLVIMKNKKSRPEAYPKPTETDNQLKNQPEFIDEQPNDFRDKSISDIPAHNSERQTNEMDKDSERGGE